MSRPESNSVGIEKWLSLIRADNVGPITFGKLLKHFGSVEKIKDTELKELTRVEGISKKIAEVVYNYFRKPSGV